MNYSDTPGDATDLFPADALTTNRAGRLSKQQLRDLRGDARSWRGKFAKGGALDLVAGAACVVAGVVWKHPGVWAVVLGIGIAVVGLVLLSWALSGTDALTEDVHEGQVKVLEGATLKCADPSSSGTSGSQGSY